MNTMEEKNKKISQELGIKGQAYHPQPNQPTLELFDCQRCGVTNVVKSDNLLDEICSLCEKPVLLAVGDVENTMVAVGSYLQTELENV